MDEQGELSIIDNQQLEWDLNKHFVLSDFELLCLPCVKDLSPDELSALSDLPEPITRSTPHTRIVKFRKVGNVIVYLHMESLNEPVGTGRLEKIRQLFLRSGQISL